MHCHIGKESKEKQVLPGIGQSFDMDTLNTLYKGNKRKGARLIESGNNDDEANKCGT